MLRPKDLTGTQPTVEQHTLEAQILDILPQTQCTQCGYNGCAPYARAIAQGTAAINQCPPGGAQGIARLSALTGQPIQTLNPAHGQEQALRCARIIEDACIGCTKCIQVCPVDAIVGLAKRMHTVLQDRCTGCDLCIPACPVDCIERPMAQDSTWSPERARTARRQFEMRNDRLIREQAERQTRRHAKLLEKHRHFNAEHPVPHTSAHNTPAQDSEHVEIERKRASIQAALERARARRTPTR